MQTGTTRTVVDTGPLVAVFSRTDQFHRWATDAFARLVPPLFTCEAVLSEVQWLLRDRGGDPLAALKLVERGILRVEFDLQAEVRPVVALQAKYAGVPMSLADACLVRMTELHGPTRLMTTDSDFRIYRRNRRQLIPLLAPGWA